MAETHNNCSSSMAQLTPKRNSTTRWTKSKRNSARMRYAVVRRCCDRCITSPAKFFPLPERKTLLIREHWLRSEGLRKTHGAEHDFSVPRPIQAYRPFVIWSVLENFLVNGAFTVNTVY